MKRLAHAAYEFLWSLWNHDPLGSQAYQDAEAMVTDDLSTRRIVDARLNLAKQESERLLSEADEIIRATLDGAWKMIAFSGTAFGAAALVANSIGWNGLLVASALAFLLSLCASLVCRFPRPHPMTDTVPGVFRGEPPAGSMDDSRRIVLSRYLTFRARAESSKFRTRWLRLSLRLALVGSLALAAEVARQAFIR